MGNRAIITFDKNPTGQSIGVYLHWNGGPESVLAFLEAANRLGVRQGDDYEIARFVQLIGNFFGGTNSVGVGKLRNLDCANGDNGIFAVARSGKEITIRQSRTGNLDGFVALGLAEIKKHDYWKDDLLLNDVLKANLETPVKWKE